MPPCRPAHCGRRADRHTLEPKNQTKPKLSDMLLYTSGTGNTEWVATELGRLLDEPPFDIAKEIGCCGQITYRSNEGRLILVFPVHSWGPALLVDRFLAGARFENIREVWAVMTCGDMCCNADKILAGMLERNGHYTIDGCFSVQMPNNYILMKGFGLDAPEVAQSKLLAAPQRVRQIAQCIAERRAAPELYIRGEHPALKSFVYRLFRRYVAGSTKFKVDEDRCVGCERCAKVCPTQNITITDHLPEWGDDCLQCSACIHRCPEQAIEWGRITREAGRYHHPSIRV